MSGSYTPDKYRDSKGFVTGDSLIVPAGLSLTAVTSSPVSHRSTAGDACGAQLRSIPWLRVFVCAADHLSVDVNFI